MAPQENSPAAGAALSPARRHAAAIADPLLSAVELPYKAVYFPFGFPAQIETNDARVLQAAHQNWSASRLHFADAPVTGRFVVSPGEIRECPPPPVYRAQRNLLTIAADRENFGCCDLTGGLAAAWVNEAVVGNPDYFRYCFLLGLISTMIDVRHLVSLHAACVVLDGQGILLTGDSGAGKTSLSFECARRGFVYVTDDCSAIVRRRGGRSVVGTPDSIRFRESAAALFPELRGRSSSARLGQQPSIEVPTAEFPWMETTFQANIQHIVLLDRREEYGTGAELVRVPGEDARAKLFLDAWPRELDSTREQEAAVERILSAGAYELRYRDLAPAVERLTRLVRSGR